MIYTANFALIVDYSLLLISSVCSSFPIQYSMFDVHLFPVLCP